MGTVETFSLGIRPLTQSPRKVYVYLPDGYEDSRDRYPVLYMFDGHNLFDDATATYGKSWGMRDYLDQTGMKLVVIGVDCNHTGKRRLNEYCPFRVDADSWIAPLRPQGEITAEWFARTLKPACEKRYRISRDRHSIGIGGSSMGGLMSVYCIARYNRLFSRAACVSPTLDICMDPLTQLIQDSKVDPDTRVYIDFGSNEVKSKKTMAQCVDNILRINREFQKQHCSTFPNIVVGGTHSEASWETIVPLFLDYLFQEE